jgi:hypothetical protein
LRDRNLRVYLEIEPGHPQLIAPSETVHACLVEGLRQPSAREYEEIDHVDLALSVLAR